MQDVTRDMKKKLSKIILKRGNIVLNVPILTMI